MKINYLNLEKKINLKFKNRNLLIKSLTHKSFNPEENNEKIEFLGDRVLGLVIAKKLLEIYPNESEGILDKKFASLVNKKTCLEISKKQVETIPRVPLIAMFLLVFVILIAVATFRFSGMPVVSSPPQAKVVAEASLIIKGEQSGAVSVMGEDGNIIVNLDGDQGGFISGVARVIERERKKINVSVNLPVKIIWRDNNRISIFDPVTNWQADLMGFGADNARAFAELLAKATKGE